MNGMPPVDFDLASYKPYTIEKTVEGMKQFTSDNPDVEVATIVITCQPSSGMLFLSVDSRENLNRIAEESGGLTDDEETLYNEIWADFSHEQIFFWQEDDWTLAYRETDGPIKIRTLGGRILTVPGDSDWLGIDRLFEDFLLQTLPEIYPLLEIRRAPVLRIGVSIYESREERFITCPPARTVN